MSLAEAGSRFSPDETSKPSAAYHFPRPRTAEALKSKASRLRAMRNYYSEETALPTSASQRHLPRPVHHPAAINEPSRPATPPSPPLSPTRPSSPETPAHAREAETSRPHTALATARVPGRPLSPSRMVIKRAEAGALEVPGLSKLEVVARTRPSPLANKKQWALTTQRWEGKHQFGNRAGREAAEALFAWGRLEDVDPVYSFLGPRPPMARGRRLPPPGSRSKYREQV